MKEGKKREKEWVMKLWMKKNKKQILLGIAATLILLLLLAVLCIVLFTHNHQTYLTLKKCLNDMEVSEDMTELTVPRNRCNDDDITVLDFSRFVHLKWIKVGDNSFKRVNTVKLVGLSELKSVVVGKNSFVASSGAFSLQNCNSLTELVIGDSSFGNYHGIVLDNLPVLERVVMDDGCFVASSLELRGLIGHISSCKELPALKTLSFGRESFRNCNRVVFESNEYKGK